MLQVRLFLNRSTLAIGSLEQTARGRAFRNTKEFDGLVYDDRDQTENPYCYGEVKNGELIVSPRLREIASNALDKSWSSGKRHIAGRPMAQKNCWRLYKTITGRILRLILGKTPYQLIGYYERRDPVATPAVLILGPRSHRVRHYLDNPHRYNTTGPTSGYYRS